MSALPTLDDRLEATAASDPDRDAFVGPAGTLSFAALAREVREAAERLAASGVTARSIVGIECGDEVRHLVLTLAVARLGAGSITLSTVDGADARDRLAALAGVTVRVDASEAVARIAPDTGRDPAPAATLLFSTSGTTGEPKIVRHSGAGLVAQAHRHVGRDERFACLATVEHNFAKRHRLYCIAEGGTNVFLEPEPARVRTRCRERGVTTLHLSVFQAQELVEQSAGAGLDGIRLKLGGSHVTTDLRKRLRTHLSPRLECGYGTTETGAIAFTDPDDDGTTESVGRPLPGIEVCVAGPDGSALPVGERGELRIRAAGMFLGYLGNQERTRASLIGDWFLTGDVGFLDDGGRIHLSGRVDDMFVFNSMNIHPQDLESVLRTHPTVADVAVLPQASTVHGAVPVALVVTRGRSSADVSELSSFARDQLGVRAPRRFKRVDALPRNRGGKLLRGEAQRLTEVDSTSVRSTIATAFEVARIADRLPAGALDGFRSGRGDLEFDDIELDSLERMDLLVALELEHGAVVSPGRLARLQSLEQLVDLVLRRSEGPAAGTLSVQAPAADVALEESSSRPVRWLRRVAGGVTTIAQFHQMLERFDERLTPLEADSMRTLHGRGQLIDPGTTLGLSAAVDEWMERTTTLMAASGKRRPEPFRRRRLASACYLFEGTGARREKVLLVCFATKGRRTLFLPQSTLLQHLDAAQHDVLVISDPWDNGFRRGAPQMGRSVHGILRWVTGLAMVGDYRAVRTLGCSAGAYPAMLLGRAIGAEVAVCASGRFPAERHLAEFCGMHVHPLLAFARNRRTRVILAYVTANRRDTVFARRIGRLTRCSRVSVEITGEGVRHNFLLSLAWSGHLADFLARTALAPLGAGLVADLPREEALRYEGGMSGELEQPPEVETSRFARPAVAPSA